MKHPNLAFGRRVPSFWLLCLLCTLCRTLQAQTLSGTVTDAENKRPLDAAMVSVLRGNVVTDYTLTDAKGNYSLPWKHDGTLQIRVSLLGYKQEIRTLSAPGTQDFSLQPQSIILKEVEIRPGRVYGRKDTVRYDLSQFASSKDVHIKDVLKKLPGVEVEENGEVKYKGKSIDHFLVEGMDVTGGRYNQVNNNLSAKAVKTAEIMENYQSVKALKGKISSEEVALNLKLDPKARDQWMANGTIGAGRGNAAEGEETSGKKGCLLWEGSANALQIGKGKQSLYNYKTNNNGTDLSTEQTRFTGNSGIPTVDVSPFLSQPSISAPLDKHRLLFNRTHTLNGNRMFKPDDERSLRLQAGYTYHRIEQERHNTRSYFRPEDTLHLDETYRQHLRSNAAYLEMNYEDNSREHYLNNRLKIEGETARGTSQELGQQQIHTSQLKACNSFRLLRGKERHTWEIGSTLQYAFLPSSLRVRDEKGEYRQQSLYMNHSANYLRKRNGFTRQCKAGIEGEWNTLSTSTASGNASSLSLYLSPYFHLERGKWQGSLSLPIRGKRFFGHQRNYFLYAPSLYLQCQVDYHWKFSLFASLNRSTGSGTDLYPFAYRTDYRTWQNNNGLIPVRLNRHCQLYGEYKNTVQEFFITASLNYHRTGQNTLCEQSVSQDTIAYIRRALSNHMESWSLSCTLSKGFYDLHLKTSLHFSLSRNTGQQLTNRLLQAYRYDYLKAEPRISWLPAKAFEAEYHATIGYGGSKIGNRTHLTPLLDFVQRLHLTLCTGHLELRLSGEHYRNDLGNGNHLNMVLADVSLIYKVKKWRLEAHLNNLFNQQEYAYTLYSATESYTSRLGIRPREAMATVSYRF